MMKILMDNSRCLRLIASAVSHFSAYIFITLSKRDVNRIDYGEAIASGERAQPEIFIISCVDTFRNAGRHSPPITAILPGPT